MADHLAKLMEDAIRAGDLAKIQQLIEQGVDIHREYYWGYPIHLAVLTGRVETIRVLANAGADLNVVGFADGPPLAGAVLRRMPEVAKCLLELEADPNLPEVAQSHTPLMIALWRKRSIESALLLVEHDADVFKIKDGTGNNALRFAVHFECESVLDLVVCKYGAKAKTAIATARHDFLLIEAARRNDFDAVKDALADAANIDAINPYGWFALFVAAENANIELMRLLLKQGATASLTDEGKKTALMAAALAGSREAVDMLLKAGADLLGEVIPGEQLSDQRDMDAVAFAREGPNRELYEYLKKLRDDLRKGNTPRTVATNKKSVLTKKRASSATKSRSNQQTKIKKTSITRKAPTKKVKNSSRGKQTRS